MPASASPPSVDPSTLRPAPLGLADLGGALRFGIAQFRTIPLLSMTFALLFVAIGTFLFGILEFGAIAPMSLSLAGGSIQWTRFHAGSWIESAPRVVAGELFIGSSDLRTVSRLDAATGDQRWTTDVLGWTWGTPAVAGTPKVKAPLPALVSRLSTWP